MTQSEYGTGDEPLTDLERQRLRPSVHVAALEQWLAVSRGELRRAVVVHFATEVTEEDVLASAERQERPTRSSRPSQHRSMTSTLLLFARRPRTARPARAHSNSYRVGSHSSLCFPQLILRSAKPGTLSSPKVLAVETATSPHNGR